MKEYMTKDRAKQFVCGHCNEVCSEEPCEPSDCDWMAFIDKEPAADVVEVVRCKDCKHYYPAETAFKGGKVPPNYGKCGFPWTKLNGDLVNGAFYCGYGERKEETHEM